MQAYWEGNPNFQLFFACPDPVRILHANGKTTGGSAFYDRHWIQNSDRWDYFTKSLAKYGTNWTHVSRHTSYMLLNPSNATDCTKLITRDVDTRTALVSSILYGLAK